MRLNANPCSSNRYLTTTSFFVNNTEAAWQHSFILRSSLLYALIRSVHPISPTTWVMYSSSGLLFFSSMDPSIILPNRLLCRNACPIS